MSLDEIAWQRVTDEAVRILRCDFCVTHSADGLPQPMWVGKDYEPGGVVLVARNPASKSLPETAKRLLERLREQQSPSAFAEWSRWRIAHMTGKPWPQWTRAFRKVVDGCRTSEQLAWLNVVPVCTRNDDPPNAELLAHGRAEHLAPMLVEVLRPAAVVTRYAAAAAAVLAIPGPWQKGGVFPINGRAARTSDTSAIRLALRDRGLCPITEAHEAPGLAPRRQSAQKAPAAAAGGSDLEVLRGSLLDALTAMSGFPPVETASYTSVGDAPAWAFVQRRVGGIIVKFRVAPPYGTAGAGAARLVKAGVDAHVGDVRSAPRSTRLFVQLREPADMVALQRELVALWRDYLRLK
jgi:hypothetical protein